MKLKYLLKMWIGDELRTFESYDIYEIGRAVSFMHDRFENIVFNIDVVKEKDEES